MASANSSGGVMGKMIDAQSIVVASTATRWYGHEGDILRYVFWHSIVLAALVGVVVTLQAYVFSVHRDGGACRGGGRRDALTSFHCNKKPASWRVFVFQTTESSPTAVRPRLRRPSSTDAGGPCRPPRGP